MTNARSIKKELTKFHESGLLVDDKYTVLRAIEAYRAMGENMKYVPGMEALTTHIYSEIHTLERIAKARGYMG